MRHLKKYLTACIMLVAIMKNSFAFAQEFNPKTFPLKNTSWYLSVEYIESLRRNGNELNLKLSKEQTSYKIEFLNDTQYKVSFKDKTKKLKTFTGTYKFSITSDRENIIEFDYDNFSNVRDRKGNLLELVPPPFIPFLEIEEFEKLNTIEKLQVLFSRSYIWGESENILYLNRTLLKEDLENYKKRGLIQMKK
ncbi:hypothetical protein [Chryseobacterium jejuense]|uniref:Uncharacterized protein n=1 Tax=Chryseobacterium jejuense TaxID=445960 RepID=A0A2X2X920_CHRJE|nr:hypothetical protein [Chryseobacterium jejuense]SDI19489.1 hypothetical protein SAMN05421542_0385 [Chryseobacterium jejuense]SQB46653.1 Uncharacterised protein [Chryseobacterium jejuense]